jgi:hypothetical protein
VTDIAIVVRRGGLSEVKIFENLPANRPGRQLFSQLASIARGLSRFMVTNRSIWVYVKKININCQIILH